MKIISAFLLVFVFLAYPVYAAGPKLMLERPAALGQTAGKKVNKLNDAQIFEKKMLEQKKLRKKRRSKKITVSSGGSSAVTAPRRQVSSPKKKASSGGILSKDSGISSLSSGMYVK